MKGLQYLEYFIRGEWLPFERAKRSSYRVTKTRLAKSEEKPPEKPSVTAPPPTVTKS